MLKLNSNSIALFLAFLLSAALAYGQESDVLSEEELFEEDLGDSIEVSDPLEPVNRVFFKVNDFFLTKVADPIASTYEWIMPDTAEVGASNFFRNLRYPIRLTGNLLQGRLKGGWIETQRFAINSTVGVFGVMDPASEVDGLERLPGEDVGQALGAWGIPEGPYLVVPFLGPMTTRDAFGYVGDIVVDPIADPLSVVDDWEWRLAYSSSSFVVESPGLISRYNMMKGSSIDPYSSLKNAYVQNRRALIEK